MQQQYDVKSYAGEIKGLDTKGRRVEMILANWNEDSYKDIITKGAFAKTLQERKDKILFLNQHNWHQPHGFFEELKETDAGLYGRSMPMPNTSYSNDAMELYERGILKEHSIGFRVVKADYDSETEIRHIKEIKLYEGSNVTLGANSNTPFLGMKSANLQEINDQADRIMKCLREGTLTDQTFLQLEIALKQLQRQSYELGKAENSTQPPPSTEPQNKSQDLLSTIHLFNKSI